MKTLGVILAGGQARRMGGGDKCMLPLGERTMLAHIISSFSEQVDPIIINANGDSNRFAEYRLPVVPDSLPDYPGPLAGVLAALEYAALHGFDQIVTVAGDTPFFPTDYVVRLQNAGGLALAASQAQGDTPRVQPTMGLWPTELRENLREFLNESGRKILKWTDQHAAKTVIFEHNGDDPFFNINTPTDVQIAAVRVGGV